MDGRGTNYFYVFTKKDHLRIESVYGTEPGRIEGLIEAGWSLIGTYSENKMQFMVAGTTTSVLDKGFACKKEIPQEDIKGLDRKEVKMPNLVKIEGVLIILHDV